MTYFDKNALKLSHEYIKENVKAGDTVIDATAGKGRDTLLLAKLVGDEGKVFAFDIQKEALDWTERLIRENGIKNVALIHDSHHNVKSYVKSARAIIFNLGFLPGSDHKIFSHPDTTIKALEAALDIIEEDGFVTVCSYYGGDTGFEEKDALIEYLSHLDQMKYTVIMQSFINRKGCPPILFIIEKNRNLLLTNLR